MLYKEGMSLQAEYDDIISQYTQLLRLSRSQFYEQGDETSKLLAHCSARSLQSGNSLGHLETIGSMFIRDVH